MEIKVKKVFGLEELQKSLENIQKNEGCIIKDIKTFHPDYDIYLVIYEEVRGINT